MNNDAAGRAAWFAERFAAVAGNVDAAVQGKPAVVRQALVCLLAEGHLLIEDVPGVGKTTLARALARSIEGTTSRIQFTPDLLPSDITGASIYNSATNAFEFRPGPVFANVVIGDEINRASPKTQSALLEVMQEQQVTVDGVSYAAPRPFVVMATQNPVEHDGTYRLPDAQLDRFLMRISLGYPDLDTEARILEDQSGASVVDELPPVTSLAEVRTMVAVAAGTYVAPALRTYIASLAAATRDLPDVLLGVSPRGSLALLRAARAAAAAANRTYVSPDDVQALAPAVLTHRLVLRPEADARGASADDVLREAARMVPVPRQVTA